ncbi:hypothetical protein RBU00_23320 [Rhizobium sp. AN63]|uniref:hypothetical protein n=1 Tax=unclassified Rhizobium TaxID=2613769 RepID=UPI0027D3C11D|nr:MULTISPECIES: hypothetical protein [unclassified Rhizobium]MDQ4408724.1 hypothetical protein [Rhizobium sp. AN63]
MLDVYHAVDDGGSLFGIHGEPNPFCPVGRNIPPVLKARLHATEQALLTELAHTTIASLAADVAVNEVRRTTDAAKVG